MITFTWDEEKRQQNIRKHHIDFREILEIFQGPLITKVDNRIDYGEERTIALGSLNGFIVLVIVYVDNDETIRIISARKATKNEQKIYYKKILGSKYSG